MSRKSWARFAGILRKLGVKLDHNATALIEQEREHDPTQSTADIVVKLALAPPEVVEQAVEIAKQEGDEEILHARIQSARIAAAETTEASGQLSALALAMAKK